MDISVENWRAGISYYKDEIVRFGGGQAGVNLINKDSGRNVFIYNLITNAGENLIEENTSEEIIGLEPATSSESSEPTYSAEFNTGNKFKIRPGSSYTLFSYLKKISKYTKLKDNTRAHIRVKEEHLTDGGASNESKMFDENESVGVGIGLKFYNQSNQLILAAQPRRSVRLFTADEISYTSYKKVTLDIEKEDIPEDAKFAQMFICSYSVRSGGFKFKEMNVKYMSDFFYAKKDHSSTEFNSPDLDDEDLWTQEFSWSPSYGSNSNFVALNEILKMGDGYDFVNNVSQNSLPMEVDISFVNRTDREAKAIVHFLQEKYFPYESMFSLDYKGDRLASSRVQSFNFRMFYPYRKNLMFTCTNFQHSITYRNNNTITAKLICNTESTLRSIEGHKGFNINDDVIIPLSINGTQIFKKDQQKIIETYSIESVGPDYYDSKVSKLLFRETRGRPSREGEYNLSIILYYTKKELLEKLDPYNYLLIRSSMPDKTGRIIKSTQEVIDNLDEYFSEFDYLDADPASLDLIAKDFKKTVRACWLNNFFDTGFLQISDKRDYNVYKNTNDVTLTFDPGFKNKFEKIIEELKQPIQDEIIRIDQVILEKTEDNEDAIGDIKLLTFLRYLRSSLKSDITNFRRELKESKETATLGLEYESKQDSWISLDFTIDQDFYSNLYLATIPRLPDDCATSKVYMPEGMDVLPHIIKDEVTGLEVKRKILTDDYRVFTLEKDIHRDDNEIVVSTDRDTIIEGPKDFFALISQARGRSSIYVDFPDSVLENPWFELRYFEYKSSNAFNLSQSPKHINTSFLKYYNKFYKKGLNQNLSSFTINFEQRSDEEAKAIILFLESHLGYKKFIWEPPRPYNGRDLNSIPTERQVVRAFFCPNWSHTAVYKNNNTITATFIESADFENPEARCIVGVNLFDKINSFNLCTFSSVALTYEQSGFSYSPADDSYFVKAEAREMDVVFIVDGRSSLSGQYISTISGTTLSKLDYLLDGINKSIVGYDVDLFPGSRSFGVYNAQSKRWVGKSGDNNRPPWPSNPGHSSLLNEVFIQDPDEESDSLEELELANYNIDNLSRFNNLYQDRAINCSFVMVGDNSSTEKPFLSDGRHLELMDFPKSFDKPQIHDIVSKNIPERLKSTAYPNANHLFAFCDTMSQFYNSRRAGIVTDRLIFFISDFNFNPADYKQIDKLRKEIRSGNSLSKRRPLDRVIGSYGIGINKHIENYGYSDSWRVDQIDVPGRSAEYAYSNIYNPDFSEFGDFNPAGYRRFIRNLLFKSGFTNFQSATRVATQIYNSLPVSERNNADWYEEQVSTRLIPIGVAGNGDSPGSRLYKYAEDFVEGKKKSDTNLYYEITGPDPASEEAFRAVDFSNTFNIFTQETGAENIYSVTIHNCGPNDIKIHNTIVAFEDAGGLAPWRTGIIKSGLTRNFDINNIEKIPSSSTRQIPNKGYGGQFYKDELNEKFLGKVKSPTAWHNFNTRYEIYSNGELIEVDGGWSLPTIEHEILTDSGEPIYVITEEDFNKDGQPLVTEKEVILIHRPITNDLDDFFIDHDGSMIVTDLMSPTPRSKGLLNQGIAFKNFPVRLFKSSKGIEVVDFNIGNVNEDTEYLGNYDHLPVIPRGGSIDLFFGVRLNGRKKNVESVQLFFHTEDMEDKYMDCYGDFKFKIFY